jgi:pimeloyl-ACP methyl ester carboxylesterase
MESMSDLSLTLIVAASPLVVAVWIACWTAFTHVRWALYYRRQDFKPRPLGGRGWVRFYLRTIGSAYIIVWWGLRAMFRDRLRYPAGARSGRPVLCVHGFHMNSTCMWGIRRHLESQGRPTRSVFLGAPYQKAEIYAGPLSRAMHELALQFPEEGFDVVAHSMGGLIVRLALARDPELAGKMHRIVTLGTPHHGTSLLRCCYDRGYRARSGGVSAQHLSPAGLTGRQLERHRPPGAADDARDSRNYYERSRALALGSGGR